MALTLIQGKQIKSLNLNKLEQSGASTSSPFIKWNGVNFVAAENPTKEFGLGITTSVGVLISDLNSISLASGLYSFNTSTTNQPSGITGSGTVNILKSGVSGNITQELFVEYDFTNSIPEKKFVRSYNAANTTWSDWVEVFTTENLTTFYSGNGTLNSNRTVNASGNDLLFNNVAEFRVNTTGYTSYLNPGGITLANTSGSRYIKFLFNTINLSNSSTSSLDLLDNQFIGIGGTGSIVLNNTDSGIYSTSSYIKATASGVEFRGNEIKLVYSTYNAIFSPTSLNANRTYTLPNATGTLALQEWVLAQGYLSSVPSLQQVTNVGSTTTGTITANSTVIGYNTGGFTGFGSNAPFSFLTLGNAAARIYTGGILVSDSYADNTAIPSNGIYSKGNINTSGTVTSNGFIKSGGTAAQFLKADGSVDSTTYLPSSASSNLSPSDNFGSYLGAEATNNIRSSGYWYQNPAGTGYSDKHPLMRAGAMLSSTGLFGEWRQLYFDNLGGLFARGTERWQTSYDWVKFWSTDDFVQTDVNKLKALWQPTVRGRYIKITSVNASPIPGTSPTLWFELSELEVYAGYTNVALGKTVSGTATSINSNVPGAIVNGQRAAFDYFAATGDDYLIIDLGAEYDITNIVLYPGSFGNFGWADIHYSSDNSTYNKYASFTVNSLDENDITWSQVLSDRWNTAYSWGNHATAGYLTSIPIASGSVLGGIKVGTGLSIDGSGVLSVSGSGSGTVTSVAMSVPTGFNISGSPITTSGTLALTMASGYEIPTSSAIANWNTAYGWGNHASAGYLTSIPTASGSVLGGIKVGTGLSINGSGVLSTLVNGTVTSVGLSMPTGFTVSNSPVTNSGTLTVAMTSGYEIPQTTSISNWNTAYGWGNHATVGYLKNETFTSFSGAGGNTTSNFTTSASGSPDPTHDGTLLTLGATGSTQLAIMSDVGTIYDGLFFKSSKSSPTWLQVATQTWVQSYFSNLNLSGSYTPTVSDQVNIANLSFVGALYNRVGNNVNLMASYRVTQTSLSQANFKISLPIASNFTTSANALGIVFGASLINTNTILGDAVNDKIIVTCEANTTSEYIITIAVQYIIL